MSKKLTHEEFVERLLSKNKYFANGDCILTGQYVGNRYPIECHCNIHNYDWSPVSASLLRECGCSECGKFNRKTLQRWSHDKFIYELSLLNKNIKALDKYDGYNASINFMCEYGHIWKATPHSIFSGSSCPYCAGRRAWIGETDLWTTTPDIAKLLKNPSDGYKYKKGSRQKVEFVCPDCGSVYLKSIQSVYIDGFSCPHCSDGVSYPNKFGRAFLKQLNIENHQCEYSPEWAKPYFYDNYFEYNNMQYILEMDGGLHYTDGFKKGLTLEERQKIDEMKTNLAVNHSINIIRINCAQSDCDYIRANILSSELNNIFDLSKIDWQLCDKNAQKNLVKEVCMLYESGLHIIKNIATIMCIGKATVRRYLKVGAKFGWCNYSVDGRRNEYIASTSKQVALVDDAENVLISFKSIHSCSREMTKICSKTIFRTGISNACKTHKPYKGFNFRFINELE